MESINGAETYAELDPWAALSNSEIWLTGPSGFIAASHGYAWRRFMK